MQDFIYRLVLARRRYRSLSSGEEFDVRLTCIPHRQLPSIMSRRYKQTLFINPSIRHEPFILQKHSSTLSKNFNF